MAGLDKETLEMGLDTLKKYGEKKLTPEYLLHLDHNEQFPHEVLKELYDPANLALHLLFIPEAYGGLYGGAYALYRVSELVASCHPLVAPRLFPPSLASPGACPLHRTPFDHPHAPASLSP